MIAAKRIDAKMGRRVKPIVIPNAPVPIRTRNKARTILTIEERIIITGSILVFKEAMTIERSRVIMAEDPMNEMATIIKPKSILKVS